MVRMLQNNLTTTCRVMGRAECGGTENVPRKAVQRDQKLGDMPALARCRMNVAEDTYLSTPHFLNFSGQMQHILNAAIRVYSPVNFIADHLFQFPGSKWKHGKVEPSGLKCVMRKGCHGVDRLIQKTARRSL